MAPERGELFALGKRPGIGSSRPRATAVAEHSEFLCGVCEFAHDRNDATMVIRREVLRVVALPEIVTRADVPSLGESLEDLGQGLVLVEDGLTFSRAGLWRARH